MSIEKFKLPKWAVVAVAAAVYLPLAESWCAPGAELHLAAGWLGLNGGAARHFPLWGALVRFCGRDLAALGWISLAAALLCVACLASALSDFFAAAVRRGEARGVRGEFPLLADAAMLLGSLAFVFTPGLLAAATRVSPVMVVLLPPLAALALVVRTACGSAATAHRSVLERLKRGGPALLAAGALLGYSGFEVYEARHLFRALAFKPLVVWGVLGALPTLLLAWYVRRHLLTARRTQLCAFSAWALVVAALAAVALSSGWLRVGRGAVRVAQQMIANTAEHPALLGEGRMDDLCMFLLPDDRALISLARDREPAYGRQLAAWVQSHAPDAPTGDATNAPAFKDDLVFAAELGPRALIDEWMRLDRAGFERLVAGAGAYFPTEAQWTAACAELEGLRPDDPSRAYLRRFLGACGNHLGCRLLEAGDLAGAWRVFWKVTDEVNESNYAALVNLEGMVKRGYAADGAERKLLSERKKDLEVRLGPRGVAFAIRSGGRVYIDPQLRERFERAQREAQTSHQPTIPEKLLAEALAAAPQDPEHGEAARKAIRAALSERRVGIGQIGPRLIIIDLALGDRRSAEMDAIDVLRVNRHDPVANATIGTLRCGKGDYAQAERYLRRAIATGKASLAARNDYAYSLVKLGRAAEAEPIAREVVGAQGGIWSFRETLAAALLAQGKTDEAARELDRLEALFAEEGRNAKARPACLDLDRARLYRLQGDTPRFKGALAALKNRSDLTTVQKAELRELAGQTSDK